MKKIPLLLSIVPIATGMLLLAACGKKNNTPKAPQQVSTLAGSGAEGFANGTGTAASFNFPSGVVVDAAGNLFVADWNNNVIRKIAPGGVVTTFAGSGTPAAADGTGVSASFSGPSALAIDATGNLYVADEGNNEVRKVTPAGVVSTLAGNGVKGFTDGQGKAASLYGPNAIAVDAAGNVYLGDIYKVRMISPSGLVTTIAGSGTSGFANGTGAAASFAVISGIAVDAQGNIFVGDNGNNCMVRKVTQAGVVSTYAGTGMQAGPVTGPVGTTSLVGVSGMIVDRSGNLYFADGAYNLVRKIDAATGMVSVVAGSTGLGAANGNYLSATFFQPNDVAMDAAGNIYVADSRNNLIRKVAAGY